VSLSRRCNLILVTK